MGEDPARAYAAEFQRILQPTHARTNALQLPNGNAQSHGADEEPYTIRCICNYNEDDGNTVLCESCDTWQHIDCYFPNTAVPDIHMCMDCNPRELDSAAAALRQRHRLDNVDGPEGRKPRRITQKGSRRPKAKELNNITTSSHTNGFAHADHKAGSPKDGGPPAKRPKTNHRSNHSLSINSTPHLNSTNGSRNRSESNAFGAGSPPTKRIRRNRPHDYFSSQLVHVHRTNTNFTPVPTNNHVDLRIAGLLSTWLDDPEAFADVTNGLSIKDVFQQAPSIEELEIPIRENTHVVDPNAIIEGGPPEVPYLTVERDVVKGELVGELRGLIGHQDDYKRDPANRWEELKHPQHFVFFHPSMPIYIDCRAEGTKFRYVRRSCKPNLSLKSFITDARDRRFCFTAECDIAAGSEITFPWDTRAVSGLLSTYRDRKCSDAELDQLHNWVETVLSHFGGCACDREYNPACAMEHLDRRLYTTVPGSPDAKPVKQGKKRKATSKKSPGAAVMSNSRASSEAVQTADPDDDDSQSNSRSSKNSRDASPNRPNSQDGNSRNASEGLSARDRKKIIAQERLFEQMEQHGDQHGPNKRRKRTSELPSTMSPMTINGPKLSRKGGQPVDSATMTDGKTQTSDNDNVGHQSSNSRASSVSNSPAHATKTPQTKSPNRSNFLPRPTYADASTQTVDPCSNKDAANKRPSKRTFAPLAVRLLRRGFERKVAAAKKDPDPVPGSSDTTEPSSDTTHIDPVPATDDVVMKDAQNTQLDAGVAEQENSATVPSVESMEGVEQQDSEPSAPPWDPAKSLEKPPDVSQSRDHRPQELHVDMPPVPSFPVGDSSNEAASSPQNPALVQSPSTSLPPPPAASMPSISPTPPVITPGGTQAPQQSPAKKKVSLSDYMQRMRKTPRTEKSQSQALEGAAGNHQHGGSSPASVSEAKTSSPAASERVGQDEHVAGAS